MPTTSLPRASRHLYRCGLPAAARSWSACTDYRASFRGIRPDAHCVSRLPESRQAARETCDPLRLSLMARAMLRPSPLILADSLRDMLRGMTCPVASAILRATESAYDCSTRLPGNHYAWRETAGKVSYCPRGREQALNAEGRWARAGRQDTTPARFARAVLPARVIRELGDPALSAFAQRFAAAEEAERLTFRVLSSAAEITEAYDNVRGTGSCMEGDPVGPWYAAAGARCVVCLRGGDWMARAILWTLENGVEFMDRVYTRDEAIREAMHAHAAGQGWHRKARQSSTEFRAVLRPDGTEYRMDMSVRTARNMAHHMEYVPYHDTFGYLTPCGTALLNCDGDDKDGGWELRRTDGEATECEHAGKVQTSDGDWIDEEDARRTIDGDTLHCDDVQYCDEDGEYYPDDDDRICYCDTRGETILSENARRVTINGRRYIVHTDDIEDV